MKDKTYCLLIAFGILAMAISTAALYFGEGALTPAQKMNLQTAIFLEALILFVLSAPYATTEAFKRIKKKFYS